MHYSISRTSPFPPARTDILITEITNDKASLLTK